MSSGHDPNDTAVGHSVPYRSDERTAVNTPAVDDDAEMDVEVNPKAVPGAGLLSGSGESGGNDPYQRIGTLAGEELFVDDTPSLSEEDEPQQAHISSTGIALGPGGGEDAPTALHATPIPDSDSEAEPDPAVAPLPDRSPGESVVDGAPIAHTAPRLQAWRVIPTGQLAVPPEQAPAVDREEPAKPHGLQTVLWTMKPLDDDNGGNDDNDDSLPDYRPADGTIARAAQTYIVEAMELLEGLKEFAPDLDEDRQRELLSQVTGCSDRLRRSLALLATSRLQESED